ncbi:MAG: HPr family phosphocarrier protein [Candidatus Eisenbacteria bacterium]
MTERILLIRNKDGIHLRPAERIAQTAGAFRSSVSLRNGETKVNGKSILGILALEGGLGTEITVVTDGPDETEAMEAMDVLFREGFGEELGEP